MLTVAAICLMTVSANADTRLFTTQQDFSGWAGNSSMANFASATDLDGSTTNGAINNGGAGTGGSLGASWISGTYNFFYGPGEQGNATFLSALGTSNTGAGYTAASGFVAIDYTKPPAGTGNYFSLGVVLNYDSNFGQFSGAETDNGNGTFTALIPYTVNATAASTYFQFGLIYNSNYDTNTVFNIDNIRVVPEPASLAVLSVAGCAIMRRRRG
jgi:hypothetical protein